MILKLTAEFDVPPGAKLCVMDAKSMTVAQSTNHTETQDIRKLCVHAKGEGEITLITRLLG